MSRRHPQRVPEYLQDMLTAIARASEYVRGMEFAQFEKDTKTQDAVVRAIEIIGEAANQTRQADPIFALRHPDIPWDAIYGMRNRIVHDYFAVDLEVVWRTVHQDLPVLKGQIDKLLEEIKQATSQPEGAEKKDLSER